MSPETALALNEINRRFYRTRAEAFGASRSSDWAGWERVLARLGRAPGPVLDVGCGNGRFGAALARARPPGPPYVGVDACAELLAQARRRRDLPPETTLLACDFVLDPDALPPGPFAAIVLFGVLHHVPGESRRRALLRALAERLGAGGLLAATLWRFGAFERFRRLEIPWDRVALAPGDLEPGDALLSFGGSAACPRYCHFVDEAEAERLGAALPLLRVDRFRADGAEGELNEYLVWERPA